MNRYGYSDIVVLNEFIIILFNVLLSFVRSFIVELNKFSINIFNVLINFGKITRDIQDPFTHHLKLSFILCHISEKIPMACHKQRIEGQDKKRTGGN